MTPQEAHGSDDYAGWLSLREIDAAQKREKGAAFRSFKRLLPQLSEGRDFVTLDHQQPQRAGGKTACRRPPLPQLGEPGAAVPGRRRTRGGGPDARRCEVSAIT